MKKIYILINLCFLSTLCFGQYSTIKVIKTNNHIERLTKAGMFLHGRYQGGNYRDIISLYTDSEEREKRSIPINQINNIKILGIIKNTGKQPVYEVSITLTNGNCKKGTISYSYCILGYDSDGIKSKLHLRDCNNIVFGNNKIKTETTNNNTIDLEDELKKAAIKELGNLIKGL